MGERKLCVGSSASAEARTGATCFSSPFPVCRDLGWDAKHVPRRTGEGRFVRKAPSIGHLTWHKAPERLAGQIRLASAGDFGQTRCSCVHPFQSRCFPFFSCPWFERMVLPTTFLTKCGAFPRRESKYRKQTAPNWRTA